MKPFLQLFLTLFALYFPLTSNAQNKVSSNTSGNTSSNIQKARILNEDVDVYLDPDFDADIVGTAKMGETYNISKKQFGPFYKIKLKNGKIGYVPDTELDIEGIGPFEPKPFRDEAALDKKADSQKRINKKQKKNNEAEAFEDIHDKDMRDEELLIHSKGITLQLVNYNEDTMGGLQTADLLALGYRYFPSATDFSSSFSYDIFSAFKAPRYYEEKTGNSANGGILWGSVSIMNLIPIGETTSFYYGAGPFLKYSYFEVKALDKKYSLQDLNLGLVLEGGILIPFNYFTATLGLKFFWDKKSYGALGLGVLF